ncbi:MAG: NifB/NifX family molybdenum-iron cluster-binding protein [Thermoplasmata archaeon]|jgi:predicted Fe-Mo cluster-binding NifX family protein|nr:NifB/NifX family molybdenum-iron cluster-binding protein [Thermoplasmata archaeon]
MATERQSGGTGKRVAVSSVGESLDSPVDPRFGRCSYFMVFEEDGGHRAVRNSGQALGNGAGIQAAQQMLDLGVDTVVTGDVGPNAFRVLAGGGVRMFVKCTGTVASAMDAYRRGDLQQTDASTSPGHHGHMQGRGPRGG